MNECLYNLCGVFGICIDFVGGYNCVCIILWIGKNCDVYMSLCMYYFCRNNGMCMDFDNIYICACNL